MGNTTTKYQFSYNVCGVPKPTLKWGFMENDTKNLINGTEIPGVHYAHNYSLSVKPYMCGKIIHFKAIGYNNKTYSWNATHKVNCKSIFYADYRKCKILWCNTATS